MAASPSSDNSSKKQAFALFYDMAIEDQPPLVEAAHKGDIRTVKKLIRSRVSQQGNVVDMSLIAASALGRERIVKALLQMNTYRDLCAMKALAIASLQGHTTIVRHLIKAGCDVNQVELDDAEDEIENSLWITSSKTFSELVGHPKVKFEMDYMKRTTTALMFMGEDSRLSCIKILIDVGADPDKINSFGFSPLILAASQGHLDIVRALIDAGADLNGQGPKGFIALIWGAFIDHLKLVETLIDAGADPNVVDSDGNSALMLAVFQGNLGIVKALIDAGADPHLENNDGRTALTWATDADIINTLIEAGAK